jgi:hypothetical protein
MNSQPPNSHEGIDPSGVADILNSDEIDTTSNSSRQNFRQNCVNGSLQHAAA